MAEFRFEQLDYPRMLFKGADTKVVPDAATQAAALKDGWKLKQDAPKAEPAAKDEKKADEKKPVQ